MGLLISIVNASNHTKRVSLSNQKCDIQPTFHLHPNEYSQEFHFYSFTFKLGKCLGSCNTLNDLSNKICVTNKTEDLYLNVFNMITGIKESKALAKHISCESKCKFDGRNCNQINGGIMINVDVSVKNVKYVKKIMFGILLHEFVKIGNI